MRRLYLRIYLAVVASLAAFAFVAAVAWHTFSGPWAGEETLTTVARNLLPPASAPVPEQQAALERLGRDLRIDLALFSSDGTRLARVGNPIEAPQRVGRQRGVRGPPVWAARLEDGRWIAARAPHRGGPGIGLFFLALLLVAIAVGAYPVVRRLTLRLERLQRGVTALGEGDLSARVRVEGRDEVARLAESFNQAAERIERLVGANKLMLASASHELRTPLARIRMAVELMKERADPTRKRELEQDIAELDGLIDEILLASRLDAVPGVEDGEAVDLLALAAEEASRYAIEVEGTPVTVKGDGRLLRRMIRNLLENAKRHGVAPVTLKVKGRELLVCDAGSGVPEGDRERIFQPFYRGARGSGLGLSIVRQIARKHGGDVRCEGNCFVVSLPAT
ncbi:MAG TPA: HAMP domain-containing sensor histidine kinase [Burkholderiales bacterium]|nr:HAMP domain-containing sensor histidine kinase [Burkholderiales bacterium]